MASAKARIYKPGDRIDYTATANITGGDPTQIGDSGWVGIPQSDIASGDSDSLDIGGIIAIEATTAVGAVGDNVWYDSNGSPYLGTASSGAATTIASAGDFWLGILAVAKTSGDTHAYVLINRPNPALPAWPNRIHETATLTLTLGVQDSGKVIHDLTDNAVITLPATAAGLSVEYIIQNDNSDGGAKLSISPNASDLIQGQNIGGTANKDLINTKITQNRGDYVILQGGHADGFNIVEMKGTWATEAG